MDDKAILELSENYPGSCRIGKGNATFLVVNIQLQKKCFGHSFHSKYCGELYWGLESKKRM